MNISYNPPPFWAFLTPLTYGLVLLGLALIAILVSRHVRAQRRIRAFLKDHDKAVAALNEEGERMQKLPSGITKTEESERITDALRKLDIKLLEYNPRQPSYNFIVIFLVLTMLSFVIGTVFGIKTVSNGYYDAKVKAVHDSIEDTYGLDLTNRQVIELSRTFVANYSRENLSNLAHVDEWAPFVRYGSTDVVEGDTITNISLVRMERNFKLIYTNGEASQVRIVELPRE